MSEQQHWGPCRRGSICPSRGSWERSQPSRSQIPSPRPPRASTLLRKTPWIRKPLGTNPNVGWDWVGNYYSTKMSLSLSKHRLWFSIIASPIPGPVVGRTVLGLSWAQRSIASAPRMGHILGESILSRRRFQQSPQGHQVCPFLVGSWDLRENNFFPMIWRICACLTPNRNWNSVVPPER